MISKKKNNPSLFSAKRMVEYKLAIEILYRKKPLDKTLCKAAEELTELAVVLLQKINKPEQVKDVAIQEELIDVSMHLELLLMIFKMPEKVQNRKYDKFLKSKDFLKYKKLYEADKRKSNTKRKPYRRRKQWNSGPDTF